MSSLAQEREPPISETTGPAQAHRGRCVSGGLLPFPRLRKRPDGNMQIVEEEAKAARDLRCHVSGRKTPSGIGTALTKRSVPTPAGKATWQASTVKSIPSNEKYRGDALLQKTFTVDFPTKKAKVNEGEAPQYYVETATRLSSCGGVRACLLNWQSAGSGAGASSAVTPFLRATRLWGMHGYFGSKVWHSTGRHRSVAPPLQPEVRKEGRALPISPRKGRGTQGSL